VEHRARRVIAVGRPAADDADVDDAVVQHRDDLFAVSDAYEEIDPWVAGPEPLYGARQEVVTERLDRADGDASALPRLRLPHRFDALVQCH